MELRRAAEELHRHGCRLTPQRVAILAAIEEAGRALDPSEVLELARRRCPELGLATVYRALEVLGDIGAVRRVHNHKGCAGVAGARPGHGHYVICSSCGRVSEFSSCDARAFEEAAARETGFSINSHFIELFGICSDCRRSAPKVTKTRRAA